MGVEYNKIIEDLKKNVNNITNTKVKSSWKDMNINLNFFNSKKTYFAIPIVVLSLFIIFSPSCIKKEVEEGDETVLKVDIGILFTYSFGISLCLIIGLFGYFYKNKTNNL